MAQMLYKKLISHFSVLYYKYKEKKNKLKKIKVR